MTMDKDLKTMNGAQLAEEVARLRAGIRKHRDERGDNRCWLDDERLYALLPDKKKAITKLPSKEVFLKSCERFWRTRQGSTDKLHEW